MCPFRLGDVANVLDADLLVSGDWCADCLGRGEAHDDDDRDPVDAFVAGTL